MVMVLRCIQDALDGKGSYDKMFSLKIGACAEF